MIDPSFSGSVLWAHGYSLPVFFKSEPSLLALAISCG